MARKRTIFFFFCLFVSCNYSFLFFNLSLLLVPVESAADIELSPENCFPSRYRSPYSSGKLLRSNGFLSGLLQTKKTPRGELSFVGKGGKGRKCKRRAYMLLWKRRQQMKDEAKAYNIRGLIRKSCKL